MAEPRNEITSTCYRCTTYSTVIATQLKDQTWAWICRPCRDVGEGQQGMFPLPA